MRRTAKASTSPVPAPTLDPAEVQGFAVTCGPTLVVCYWPRRFGLLPPGVRRAETALDVVEDLLRSHRSVVDLAVWVDGRVVAIIEGRGDARATAVVLDNSGG